MNIAHLKSKILDLAVRGKLTEQRPEDSSAAELLGRVREEKQRLIAEGKIKKEKKLPEITEDEKPFNIPASWEWCRLGEICDINPRNNIEKNIDVSFVPMACINPGFSKEFTYEVRQWDSVKSGFTVFADNDVGIAKITPCFENRKSVLFKNLVNGFGAGTTELHILRPAHNILLDTFLFWFVKTERFIKNGIACFSGAVGQQRIGKDYVANTLFPLPPLAEQKRIVEKIEAIFKQADIIEENRLALKTAVRHTKSRVLDLAVRGKLTEQRPEEGSAEELLERIREEKQRLIAEGKLKKEKPLPEITEEEIPFDIPAGWKWCRLGEICEVISKGTTPQGGKSAFESSSGIKFLKVENILSDGTISHCGISYITESHHFGVLKRSILQKDDLLISIAGTLGKLAIVRDCDLPLNTNQAIAFVRFLDRKKICIKYIFYILSSNLLKTLLTSCSKVTAIPNLTLEILWNLHIPLPPLAEQKRIVEKIEQIFGVLDIIENAVEG